MVRERVTSLEVTGLSGGYGRVPVLHGIDLAVGEGEVVGVLGHNGMGKSTLLKTLMGFLPVRAGSVRYYGTDITRLPPHARARLGLGYVPQGRGIFPRLSVRENLEFARQDCAPEIGQDGDGTTLVELLAQFPRLEPLLERRGEALSGGEQQMLALARCLAGDPEFLLLDEPTEGIQPSIIEDMAQILSGLGESRGLSILLVEQNFDFIADLSDRVLVLERGRITGELARGDLTDRAKVERYLGFGAAGSTDLGRPAAGIRDRLTSLRENPVRKSMDSRLRGNDGISAKAVIPAQAGIHTAYPNTNAAAGRIQASPPAHLHAAPGGSSSGVPTSVEPSSPSSSPHPTRNDGRSPVDAMRADHGGSTLPPSRDTGSSSPFVPSDLMPAPAGPHLAVSAQSPPSPTMVSAMTVKRPVLAQMRAMADRFGMRMSDTELDELREIMEPYIQAYDRIDAAPDNLPHVRFPRSPGHRPSPAENPLNAWYYKTEVRGAPDGPLRGRRIVLKDTVCLAGVPMMNGSSIMEGYTPEIDATVVTRILEAGGTIVGKAHCENFCLSGGSHTNAAGPVHNPWKRGYMAGGSSSGSAALVAAGEVDMAIGGDQGGSIRIPSSNCGVYGMKPTHGLVPYTGVMPVEQTIDHVGPITATVADNALFLEVLAGEDGLDPRQYAPEVHRYTEALGRGCAGLRIGVLKEGFHRPESEPDVDRKVLDAAQRFRELGARVQDVSVEEHHFATDLWTAIAVEGLQDLMMHGNNAGTNHRGLFLPSMIDRVATWRHRADELSHSLKTCMFLGEYFRDTYRGRYYGKAQNLMRSVMCRYLDAFRHVDLLLMPTLPMKAQPIPPSDCSMALYVQRAFEMVGNTAAFSVSGLPAMSIPCGLGEGLPIGMMLVGPHWSETTIYRAAHAFEQSVDWRTL